MLRFPRFPHLCRSILPGMQRLAICKYKCITLVPQVPEHKLASRSVSTACIVDSIPNLDELAAKLKCHPSIPCGATICEEDIVRDWYRSPADTLPQSWSNDWPSFRMIVEFFPYPHDMGPLDLAFKMYYDIQYPIKGVMYKDLRSDDPIYDDAFIFQDANEDYFVWGFYQEETLEHDNYLRRYKIPRGTLPEKFVRNFHLYKEEMEDIHPLPEFQARYEKAYDEQFTLARIRGRVKPCACYPGAVRGWCKCQGICDKDIEAAARQ